MDEHVSSTTANPESELDKLPQDFGPGDSDTEVLEDNEALAKNHVDEDDLSEPEENERHIAAEDPPKETFLESPPGLEPQAVTEPEAPLPTYSAVADSTEEPTQSDTEDTTPEPEKEETIEPTTEDTIPQPETEATTVLPEPEGTIHRPDTPTEAPVSPPKESPASESAAPRLLLQNWNIDHRDEPIISSSAPSPPQPLSSSAHMDAPYHQPQDLVKDMDDMSKDLFSSKSSRYETNSLSSKADSGDDFLFEGKPSASSNNPFQSFAPVDDSRGDLPLFVEAVSGRMTESPTPDLVQYAHDGESPESASAKHTKEPPADLVRKISDAIAEASEQSDPSTNLPTSARELRTPPSLPDILKLSPLNPDKEDSGSSEASSDSERSPARRLRNATHPALNSFSFDAKVLLLKEMAEETEARAAEKKRKQEAAAALERRADAFDLVRDAKTTAAEGKGLQSTTGKDWMFSSNASEKLADDKPESTRVHPSSVNLPPSPPSKSVVPVGSDSGSPITDSLSPVLGATAKFPQSSGVELESRCTKDSKAPLEREVKGLFGEEPEALEEVSEHEASSEEFEFVERPPKGAIDEFLETLDSSKLAKAPERGMEYDLPTFGQSWMSVSGAEPESQEVASSQTAGLFSSQPAPGPSPQMFKADLDQSKLPSESFAHDVQKLSPVSHEPHTRPTPEELLKPRPLHDALEDPTADSMAQRGAPAPARLPSLKAEQVVDLLYWRDIKTTGVVFGALLFLLLSLTVCSIVSVCSYVALALLSVSISFRIYKGILQAVQKSDEGHPFKVYLDQDVALPEDSVHQYSDLALERINVWILELRRLFLVEDLVDSLKFAVGMWVLTYVGALFNGLTLLILALIGVFSCPVIYEKNQKQIDHYVELVTGQVKDTFGKIQAKVPGLKRKSE